MDKEETVTLHTGNEMPILGLGTWQLTNDTPETIAYAFDKDYRLIDTSSDYGTQPGIGKAIQKSDVDRESIYITTKVEETDDAYKRVKTNLNELNLDQVKLTVIHRPPPRGAGEKLWEGLIRAKEDGLTQDIGVSNYSLDQIETLIKESNVTPVVNQIEWSPFGFSQEMKEYCDNKKIIIQAYSPLTRTKRLGNDTLNEIATSYNKSPAQILIRWNLQLGTVPIPKANQKTHLDENIDVFDFEINEEDIQRLKGLNEEYSSLGASLQYV